VDELFWMGPRLVAATHGRGMFAIETGGGTSPGDSGASSAPAPWAGKDIGSVSHSGSTTYANGTFTLTGRGADVWGSADAFHFAYQTLAGDGVIVAHVASVQNVSAWTKAGLMIRGTLDADSVHASIFVTPGKGIALQYRAVTGGESSNVGAPGSAPQWIKLSRAGSVITASASPDGGAWVPVGHATLTLPGTAFVGLVIGSHDDTRTAAAAFDHVSIMPLPSSTAVPALWQAADVGAVGAKGSASEHGGVFAVKGAGADIWDAEDAFQYVYRELAGNGSIVARVASVQYVDAWTKAGVMVRQSLDPGSAHASLFVTPGKGIAFQRRTAHAGTSTNTSTPGAAPRWVKLTRAGQLVTAFTSVDGAAWMKIDQDTIAISGVVWAGLAVSSHAAGTPAAASFDMVSVSEASSLPASWLDLDIGSVGITGSAAYKSGTFTVSASGNDIWNTRDAFHFVYQTLADDGQITARVATIESGHRWTKAAVMIRQTTSAKSAFAMMTVSAAAGSAFQYRSASGALAASIAGSSAAVPQWIRIARAGDTLSGYQSSDGLSWKLVGTATIAMGQSVDIGLAVTSHDNTLACKASFDHVSR
jgi:regulation of enolase protein 1 (concanavalin A-like superfamily)